MVPKKDWTILGPPHCVAAYIFRSMDGYSEPGFSRHRTRALRNKEVFPILDLALGPVLVAELRQEVLPNLCLAFCGISGFRTDRNCTVCRKSQARPPEQDFGTYEPLDDLFRIANALFHCALRLCGLLR